MNDKIFDVKLDPEKQNILTSVESGEWEIVDNFQQEVFFDRMK